ncbi:Os10g0495900, partial [Oryza sativa Japonica Group]
ITQLSSQRIYTNFIQTIQFLHTGVLNILPDVLLLRLTFLIAESCLLAGLVQSAYHTRYRKVFFENPPDCETVRRGTFGAGAAFSLITCVLTGAYYFYFSKSRVSYARREATIGMSPYS